MLTPPACPTCQSPMALRRRKADDGEFWGCSHYPDCRGARNLNVDEQMARRAQLAQLAAQPAPRAGDSTFQEYATRRNEALAEGARHWPLFLVLGLVGIGVGLLLILTNLGGQGLFGPLLIFLTLIGLPVLFLSFLPSDLVSTWLAGARGEEATGRLLDSLAPEGFYAMHDRQMPGGSENIDHLVLGPTGIFVVETKNYGGGLWLGQESIFVGRYNHDAMIAQVKRQVRAIETLITPLHAKPLICLHRARLPKEIVVFQGVKIFGPATLLSILRAGPCETDPQKLAQMQRLARALDKKLLPASHRQ
jgi:hypothetical protein